MIIDTEKFDSLETASRFLNTLATLDYEIELMGSPEKRLPVLDSLLLHVQMKRCKEQNPTRCHG